MESDKLEILYDFSQSPGDHLDFCFLPQVAICCDLPVSVFKLLLMQ